MTTSTYKNFGMSGKQESTNIHSNTEKIASPFSFKKTATLILFVVDATTLLHHKINNNTSGQSNYVCRVESTSSQKLIPDLSERLTALYPNISQILEKLNKKFPAEEKLITKIIEKMNMFNKPQGFQEVDLVNILECLSLSSKEDKKEFKQI